MAFSSLTSLSKNFIAAISGKKPPEDNTSQVDDALCAHRATDAVKESEPPARSRNFPWGKVFFFSLCSLLLLSFAMWGVSLIETLLGYHPVLAGLGSVLLFTSLLALLVICGREIFAMMRLKKITSIRKKAEQALVEEDGALKEYVLSETHRLYADRTELSTSFDRLAEQNIDKMTADQRLSAFEAEVMSKLDEQAKHVISNTAKAVSMLTAVSPVAAMDVAFVCWQNLRMLHKLARIYAGRPGTFETVKLAKMVLTHLALTGGIAMGDNLLQNLLGRGLAAKVSTRLGEGLANGILTSRVGLAALDLCRPLAFDTVKKPSLKSLIGPLLTLKTQDNIAT